MNKLSHSSINRFSDCPKSFDLHYNHRLRSKTMSAALLFGTAIDKSVEKLVQTKNLEEALRVFNEIWQKQEINGVLSDLMMNPNIVFAKNDLDLDLAYLSDTELEAAQLVINKKDQVGFDNLSEKDKIYYNCINWQVAKVRGELMLKAVHEEIIPKITKVYSTQEQIDLNNGTDSVIGYVDMVAEYEGHARPIIFDFKTSTRPYEADSVRTSPQLALYVHALENKYKTRSAGFIVLSKQIQKNRTKVCSACGFIGKGSHKTCNNEAPDGERCGCEWIETINPKAKIEVIIDEIPEQLENIVLENFDNGTKLINSGIYMRNLSACVKNYGPCTFINLCHQNSMEGLVKVEKK